MILGYLAERVCQPVQLVVAGDYPIDAEIAGECVRGYPAERIGQPVQLMVAGDHTI